MRRPRNPGPNSPGAWPEWKLRPAGPAGSARQGGAWTEPAKNWIDGATDAVGRQVAAEKLWAEFAEAVAKKASYTATLHKDRWDSPANAERTNLWIKDLLALISTDSATELARYRKAEGLWADSAKRMAATLGYTIPPLGDVRWDDGKESATKVWIAGLEESLDNSAKILKKTQLGLEEAQKGEQRWADYVNGLGKQISFTKTLPPAPRWDEPNVARSEEWMSDLGRLLEESITLGKLYRVAEKEWADFAVALANVARYDQRIPDHAVRLMPAERPKSTIWAAGLVQLIRKKIEAGNVAPIVPRPDDAYDAYGAAHSYYLSRDYAGALIKASQAISWYPRDARFYYLRGIARQRVLPHAPGEAAEGVVDDFLRGVALERQSLPDATTVGRSFENIQDPLRDWLDYHRFPGRKPVQPPSLPMPVVTDVIGGYAIGNSRETPNNSLIRATRSW